MTFDPCGEGQPEVSGGIPAQGWRLGRWLYPVWDSGARGDPLSVVRAAGSQA